MLYPTHPKLLSLPVAEHRLRFQVQLADVEVAEREDAVLECQVPLETIPTSWYLEDRELQPSHKYVMEEQGVLRRLTIRDARIDDDGIYLCQMKDKGRSIAEVSVRGGVRSLVAQICLPIPLLPGSPLPPAFAFPPFGWCLLLPLFNLFLLPRLKESILFLSIPPWPSYISSRRGDCEAAATEAGCDGGGECSFLCGDTGCGRGELLEPGWDTAAGVTPNRA